MRVSSSARTFGTGLSALAVLAAILAAWAPISFSVATVFLFAGPHNWFELRYFLSRLPSRLGPLRNYFVLSIGGVLALTASYACLFLLARAGLLEQHSGPLAAGLWNTAFVAWTTGLIFERSRQNPRRSWTFALPVGLVLIVFNWMFPSCLALVLIYLHPLISLWMLDRELRRRPDWRFTYRWSLACGLLLLGILCWSLMRSEPIIVHDSITWHITRQSGSGMLTSVSSHLLVSIHAYLEMLHYAVWLVGIPLVTMTADGWRLKAVPMERRGLGCKQAVLAALVVSGFLTVVLWAAFLVDYTVTLDIYIAVAIAHVLAELPFLLRSL